MHVRAHREQDTQFINFIYSGWHLRGPGIYNSLQKIKEGDQKGN